MPEATPYPPAIQAQADARREFAALLPRRWDLNSRRLPPATFDASFPTLERRPGNRGWERVPEGFVGAVQLILRGIRLRWVEVPPVPGPPRCGAADWADGNAYYWSDVNAHTRPRLVF